MHDMADTDLYKSKRDSVVGKSFLIAMQLFLFVLTTATTTWQAHNAAASPIPNYWF
jgi:hypothetical protein